MIFAVVAAWLFLLVAVSAHFAGIGIAIARALLKPRPAPGDLPPVSLLRPVCGLENGIEATLRSSFSLDYPRYEIVFCVAQSADPVVPLVERLMAENPGIPARLLVGDERISINAKLNNLVKGWTAARYGWVLMADSNLLLPPDYIGRLLARWGDGTGLVCSPPIGGEPKGFAAEIECAFLNTFQARWQIAADSLGFGFAQGKTMLWRRAVLDAAGGLPALAAEPAEDAAATKVVRRAGLAVRLVPGPFRQPLGRRSLAEVWRRQLRWARLRRVSFPVFYGGEVLAGSAMPLAAGALLVAAGALPAPGLAGIALAWYGAEALLAALAGWHIAPLSPLAWLARDLAIPPLWLASFAGNGFVWRGNAMEMRGPRRPAGLNRAEAEAALQTADGGT